MGLFWFNFKVVKGKNKGTIKGRSQYFLFMNTCGNTEPYSSKEYSNIQFIEKNPSPVTYHGKIRKPNPPMSIQQITSPLINS